MPLFRRLPPHASCATAPLRPTAMGTVPAQSRTALQTARTRTHARTRAHTHAHRSRVSGLPRGCHPRGGSSQWAALPVAAWTPAVARESRASSHREHPGCTGCRVLAQPARTACNLLAQPGCLRWQGGGTRARVRRRCSRNTRLLSWLGGGVLLINLAIGYALLSLHGLVHAPPVRAGA
jgi:hypothetical protein